MPLLRRSLASRVVVLLVAASAVLAGWPSTAAADPGGDAILAAWQASGGATGPLGNATAAETCALPGGGCSEGFEHGTYYWSSTTGAHFVLADDLGAAWDAAGGVSGDLGWPTLDTSCPAGASSCRQVFEHGTMAWSAANGAFPVMDRAGIQLATFGTRWSAPFDSQIGFPTAAVSCTLPGGGCVQTFERGALYLAPSADTAHVVVNGTVQQYWARQSGVTGSLGYPVTDHACIYPNWDCYQQFSDGDVVSWTYDRFGVLEIDRLSGGDVVTRWLADAPQGKPALGIPRGGVYCQAGRCSAGFEAGRIYADDPNDGRTVELRGPTYWEWSTLAQQWPPVAEQVCGLPDGGCRQDFSSAGRTMSIYWTPTLGAHALSGPGLDEWVTQGSLAGLGYPVTDAYGTAGGGSSQLFERGGIHASPSTGVRTVLGPIAGAYDALRGESGPLGYPVTEQYPTVGGGASQVFQSGGIHWSPATGAHAVVGRLAAAYDALRGESGPLGYPVSEAYPTLNGGSTQLFQNGGIHSSPASGTHVVLGGIARTYDSLRGESGPLGYPVSDAYPTTNGGSTQLFQNGGIHSSPASGTHVVLGDIARSYDALRGESGPLGYPVSEQYPTKNGGRTQLFQNGGIHVSQFTGVHAVIGPIAAAYDASGGEAGVLDYPAGEQFCGLVGGGCGQQFVAGSIYWSPASGAHLVVAPIRAYWAAHGWEAGTLGYPTTDTLPTPSGYRQWFQRGTVVWNARTGIVTRG